jgi:polysaccharide deacetylase family protein (PEP-CTERM system associated)
MKVSELRSHKRLLDADAIADPSYDEQRAGVSQEAELEPIKNGMSIDVEEYFQVWAFSNSIRPGDWDSFPSRIEESVDTALQLFEEAEVSATFFTLGWIADRHPALIRRITAAGHELASHGYGHGKVTSQTRNEFREDVARAKRLLEDVSGQEVLGYRAPSFSIGAANLWALDVLQEMGHQYSSSVYPIRHDHYGMPEASRFPFRREPGGILEVPMSTVNVLGRNYPCAGGGYFRLVPYSYFRWACRRLNQGEGRPAVFYFHPWELDPDQPRMKNASLRSRFRHYVNLSGMEDDLRSLLSDFAWDRMDRVFVDRPAA